MNVEPTQILSLERTRSYEAGLLSDYKNPSRLQEERARVVASGSVYGRMLAQYQEILGHSGAVNFMQVATAKNNPIIVDVGCATGIALSNIREDLPTAKLIGIDIRSTPLNTVVYPDGSTEVVEQMMKRDRIEFHQDTMTNIDHLLPQGYDVLLAVASFYDDSETDAPSIALLEMFYRGLRPEGIAQLLYTQTPDALVEARKYMDQQSTPHTFTPADPGVLARNSLLSSYGSSVGILTLGPK